MCIMYDEYMTGTYRRLSSDNANTFLIVVYEIIEYQSASTNKLLANRYLATYIRVYIHAQDTHIPIPYSHDIVPRTYLHLLSPIYTYRWQGA